MLIVKKIPVLVLLLVFVFLPAFAEETALLPGKTLRVTLAPSFGFQVQEWEGREGAKVMLFNTGLGLGYGVSEWFNVQVLWVPGVNAWSELKATSGTGSYTYGYNSDIFLGLKIGILGPDAPLVKENMRFALAAGLVAPLPVTDGSDWEGAYHLWGTALRLYYDYVFTPLFYLNVYVETAYYPNQRLVGPNYGTRSVDHPLDLNFELDFRFQYPLEEKGMILHWGVPLRFFAAPWINRNDSSKGNERVMRFTPGVFFTASWVKLQFPFDLTLRYEAPLWGKYDMPIHRVSLLGRIYVKF
jgi:hypothetical protein